MKKRILMLAGLSLLGVATCLPAGTASAQPILKGTFTLPYEVRWGRALLPPGQYTIRLDGDSRPALVRTRAGQPRAFVMARAVERASTEHPTAILITQGEGERTVRSLNFREANKSFVYDPLTKAERRHLAQAVTAVPLRMAEN